jgi:regulator of cell morphogenesis and NO signaling
VREKSVAQICDERQIDTSLFLTIANLFNGYKAASLPEYTPVNVRTIIRYLENSHRYYLKEIYPRIRMYIEEINKINNHAEIPMIGKFFDKYFLEVTEHLDYENALVFPYVLDLDNLLTMKSTKSNVRSYSATEYREHHNDIEEKLNDLKNLLIKYMPQKNDQAIRRQLILSLFELEYDLNIHSKIEESILIPLVEKMELLIKKRQ